MLGSHASRSAHSRCWRSPPRVSVLTGPWPSSRITPSLLALMYSSVAWPTS